MSTSKEHHVCCAQKMGCSVNIVLQVACLILPATTKKNTADVKPLFHKFAMYGNEDCFGWCVGVVVEGGDASESL